MPWFKHQNPVLRRLAKSTLRRLVWLRRHGPDAKIPAFDATASRVLTPLLKFLRTPKCTQLTNCCYFVASPVAFAATPRWPPSHHQHKHAKSARASSRERTEVPPTHKRTTRKGSLSALADSASEQARASNAHSLRQNLTDLTAGKQVPGFRSAACITAAVNRLGEQANQARDYKGLARIMTALEQAGHFTLSLDLPAAASYMMSFLFPSDKSVKVQRSKLKDALKFQELMAKAEAHNRSSSHSARGSGSASSSTRNAKCDICRKKGHLAATCRLRTPADSDERKSDSRRGDDRRDDRKPSDRRDNSGGGGGRNDNRSRGSRR